MGSSMEQITVMFKSVVNPFVKGVDKASSRIRRLNTQINNQSLVMDKQRKQMLSTSKAHRDVLTNAVARGKAIAKVDMISARNTKMNAIARQGFFDTMSMGMPAFKNFNEQGRNFTTVGGRMANRFRLLTHGVKGFRMEMLGVMFFGQMLQRTFVGLLQPVMEAFGVFDIFRLMLLTLFLPIMEDIFPVLLNVMKWFMDLPDPIKELIGGVVLFIAGIGGLLFIIGAMSLGAGSIIQVFSDTGTAAGNAAGKVNSFSGALKNLGIVAAVGVAVTLGISGMNEDDARTALMKIFGSSLAGGIAALLFGVGVIPAIFIGALILTVELEIRFRIFDKIKETVSSIGSYIGEVLSRAKAKFGGADFSIKELFTGKSTSDTAYWNQPGRPRSNLDDFIWRPGQGAASINPNDTVVGFKGAAPDLGGGSTNIVNNFNGFTMEDLNRELDNRDRRMVEDIRRIVKQ